MLFAAPIVLFVCSALLGYASRYEEVQDRSTIIRFSHRFHVDEAGAECADCHEAATDSHATSDNLLPSMDTCYGCHDEDETACDTCHLEAEGDYSPWILPDRRLVFDHALHVGQDEVSCASCHAGIETVDYGGPEHLPSMQSCLDCHATKQVIEECMLCHTDVLDLRPASHTAEFFDRHGDLVRAGDTSCASCHGLLGQGANDCQICHEGDQTLPTAEPPVDQLSAGASTNADDRKPQRLDRVHALDYRFHHALEARAKRTDCAVCHDSSTFCTDCHNAEGIQMRPLWHGGPDWGAVPGGVGTGGGRHGAMARRDLENCASCHDVQGEDPTCLQCHMDMSPGLGNDPKTHESGFMRNVEGAWHDDPSDVCYACHRPSMGSAPGFCTYCHGPRDQ